MRERGPARDELVRPADRDLLVAPDHECPAWVRGRLRRVAVAPDRRQEWSPGGWVAQAERLLELVNPDLVMAATWRGRPEDERWVQRVGEGVDEPCLAEWIKRDGAI